MIDTEGPHYGVVFQSGGCPSGTDKQGVSELLFQQGDRAKRCGLGEIMLPGRLRKACGLRGADKQP
jgi:hypothetical protein